MIHISDILQFVVWLAMATTLFQFVMWVAAMAVFAYMRNTAAHRNDEKRERLWKKQERILKVARKNMQAPGGM